MTAGQTGGGNLPRELTAAAGTLAWADGLLGPDGSFAGAEDSVSAYYLAPLAFALGGRPDRAQQLIDHVRRRFFSEGDINRRAGESDSQVANFRNSFFGLAAQRVGAWDMSIALADALERCQHPDSGGFANHNLAASSGRALDVGSSAAALICLLANGRLAAAKRAGDFLSDAMVDGQPNPGRRVLLRRTWAGAWIDEFAPADAPRHRIELGEPGQVYWFLGIGMAALGQLFAATGQEKYLAAARRIFEWTLACHPGSFADLTAAKVGWGCSVLFAVTGEEEFAVRARYVSHVLCVTQLPQGIWLRRPAVMRLADQDLVASLDTSLERVCWLIEIARNLQVRRGEQES